MQGFFRVYFALVEFALVTAITLTCYVMIVKHEFSIREARRLPCNVWVDASNHSPPCLCFVLFCLGGGMQADVYPSGRPARCTHPGNKVHLL